MATQNIKISGPNKVQEIKINNDPMIQISGYGSLKASQVEKEMVKRTQSLLAFIRKKDWRNVKFILNNSVYQAFAEALAIIQDKEEGK